MNTFLGFLILGLLFGIAFFVKPIRKTIGLCLVILGGICCLTIIGLIIGIPAILLGGLLLFI